MKPRRFFRAEGLPFGPGPGEHEPHAPKPGPRTKPKPSPKGMHELPMTPQRSRALANGGERPAPRSYDPRVSHDGRNVGLGRAGVGAPAFSITSRVKPLKPSQHMCGPGPAAYGDTLHPIKSHGSGTSTLGSFSPRQGGMTGRAAPPRKQLEEKRPGPGGYTPGVDRTGRSLASGGGMPSWPMSDRPSKLMFISKAHSEIDNAGRCGPGPAAYSPRQPSYGGGGGHYHMTLRGEREHTSAYAVAMPEEVE